MLSCVSTDPKLNGNRICISNGWRCGVSCFRLSSLKQNRSLKFGTGHSLEESQGFMHGSACANFKTLDNRRLRRNQSILHTVRAKDLGAEKPLPCGLHACLCRTLYECSDRQRGQQAPPRTSCRRVLQHLTWIRHLHCHT